MNRFFQEDAIDDSDLSSNFWQDFTGQTNWVKPGGTGESVGVRTGCSILGVGVEDMNGRSSGSCLTAGESIRLGLSGRLGSTPVGEENAGRLKVNVGESVPLKLSIEGKESM